MIRERERERSPEEFGGGEKRETASPRSCEIRVIGFKNGDGSQF